MDWPDVLRVITVILALCYMPLLYLRMMRTEDKVSLLHLFGTFCLVAGLITGSWQSYKASFHWGQIFFLSGVVVKLLSGIVAERRLHRKRLKR